MRIRPAGGGGMPGKNAVRVYFNLARCGAKLLTARENRLASSFGAASVQYASLLDAIVSIAGFC